MNVAQKMRNAGIEFAEHHAHAGIGNAHDLGADVMQFVAAVVLQNKVEIDLIVDGQQGPFGFNEHAFQTDIARLAFNDARGVVVDHHIELNVFAQTPAFFHYGHLLGTVGGNFQERGPENTQDVAGMAPQ